MKREIYDKLKEIESEINRDAKIEYHKRFLEITGLKVGDIVKAYFSTSHGSSKQSFSSLAEKDAFLKQHENGVLYLESVEPLQKSFSNSNGRSGGSYRGWWEYCKQICTTEIKDIIIDKEDEQSKI